MRAPIVASVIALLLPLACGGSDESGGDATFPAEEVRVFAASSLTAAFEELGESYIEDDPSTKFTFNFLSSADLATQLEQGAGADVFASADEANMQRVAEAGLLKGDSSVFVHNRLEIIVAPGNPLGINSLEDLSRPDLVVSLCNEDCPAGAYANVALDKAGVRLEADSLEPEVKAVVTRVQLGEADAGIVYASDVAAAGEDAAGVVIPKVDNVIATYPIAVLKGASSEASGFVELVLSDEGHAVLEEYGFLTR